MVMLLYSKAVKDAVSAALLRIASKRSDIEAVSVEDLIAKSVVRRRANGGYQLDFKTDALAQVALAPLLVNRAFISEGTLTMRTKRTVSDLALQTEMESALSDAINLCQKSTALPGQYSLCGHHLPLYLQWSRVRATCPGLCVPRYAYPFGSVAPEVNEFSKVIYKPAYDLRTWKPNSPPPFWWHTFAVERPAGNPIVASIVDGNVLIHGEAGTNACEIILDRSNDICRAFGTIFGEILYFADGDTITFAAFSHPMATEIAPSKIDPLLEDWLTRHPATAAQ